MSDRTHQPEKEPTLVEYLSDHDFECPTCRYNLRGLAQPVCAECGRDLSDFDYKRISQIRHDVDWERTLIAIASICLIAFGLGPMMLTFPLDLNFTIEHLILFVIMSPFIIAGFAWWRTRHNTQRRLLNKHEDRYDGTSWVGNCSMFILAGLSIPLFGMYASFIGLI